MKEDASLGLRVVEKSKSEIDETEPKGLDRVVHPKPNPKPAN